MVIASSNPLLLGWQQSVSKLSVTELDGFLVQMDFNVGWRAEELWLAGSYAGFMDGTHDPGVRVESNAEWHRGEDLPPDFQEIDPMDEEQEEEPPVVRKKRTAVKKKSKPTQTSKTSEAASSAPVVRRTSRDAPIPPGGPSTSSGSAVPPTPCEKAAKKSAVPSATVAKSAAVTVGSAESLQSGSGLWTREPQPPRTPEKGRGDQSSQTVDLTGDESPLVIVTTESAPTSQAVTSAGQTSSPPHAMDVDRSPVRAPSSSLLPTLAEAAQRVEQQQLQAVEEEHANAPMETEASQQSGTQPSDRTDGGRSQSVASVDEALAEHDYARLEGFPPRDSDSDGLEEEEPSESGDKEESGEENQPATEDAGQEGRADEPERERESSGEYVDAPTVSQAPAQHAEKPPEQPP